MASGTFSGVIEGDVGRLPAGTLSCKGEVRFAFDTARNAKRFINLATANQKLAQLSLSQFHIRFLNITYTLFELFERV